MKHLEDKKLAVQMIRDAAAEARKKDPADKSVLGYEPTYWSAVEPEFSERFKNKEEFFACKKCYSVVLKKDDREKQSLAPI